MVRTIFTAALLAGFATSAFADGIMVMEPYARTSRPNAPNGAAFMQIMNHTDRDVQLIAVEQAISNKAELHTHEMNVETGVVKMFEVEDGFSIPAGETLTLERGGNHIMILGLNEPLIQDSEFALKLIFENADPIDVNVIVDNERVADDTMEIDHSGH